MPARPFAHTRASVLVVGLGLVLAGCGGSAKPTPKPPAHPPRSESAGVLGMAALADAHYQSAPPAEQTHPVAAPGSGGATTVFTLRLTPGRTLGVSGHGRYEYEILIAGPRPRCTQFTDVTAARRGARLDVPLDPPIAVGWCVGLHRAIVLLEENPYCPPPPASGPAPACQLFKARSSEVGQFSFLVR
jgi:hypothetical protein